MPTKSQATLFGKKTRHVLHNKSNKTRKNLSINSAWYTRCGSARQTVAIRLCPLFSLDPQAKDLYEGGYDP
jgi:hypothetical protein